jgi:predicted Mrr-cat superfamily restriction endonuclease
MTTITESATGRTRTAPWLWLVRAERKGQDKAFNFREAVTSIHWNDAPDPRTHSKQQLEAYFAAHRDHGKTHAAEQIYRFCHVMQIGDYVATPRWNNGRRSERVAVGVVTGEYEY